MTSCANHGRSAPITRAIAFGSSTSMAFFNKLVQHPLTNELCLFSTSRCTGGDIEPHLKNVADRQTIRPYQPSKHGLWCGGLSQDQVRPIVRLRDRDALPSCQTRRTKTLYI